MANGNIATTNDELQVTLTVAQDASRGLVLLAADASRMLTGRSPGHVGPIRTAIEEHVSVIANAIRRARDELTPNR